MQINWNCVEHNVMFYNHVYLRVRFCDILLGREDYYCKYIKIRDKIYKLFIYATYVRYNGKY